MRSRCSTWEGTGAPLTGAACWPRKRVDGAGLEYVILEKDQVSLKDVCYSICFSMHNLSAVYKAVGVFSLRHLPPP